MKLVSSKKIEGCKCEPVENPEDVKELIHDMIRFMSKNNGIGLAAPQVGIYKRFFIMKDFRNPGTKIVINPQIVWKSIKKGTFEEGCLSYPGKKFRVQRHKQIKAVWVDEAGTHNSLKMSGREAQVFQHEFDHLDGIVIKNNHS